MSTRNSVRAGLCLADLRKDESIKTIRATWIQIRYRWQAVTFLYGTAARANEDSAVEIVKFLWEIASDPVVDLDAHRDNPSILIQREALNADGKVLKKHGKALARGLLDDKLLTQAIKIAEGWRVIDPELAKVIDESSRVKPFLAMALDYV